MNDNIKVSLFWHNKYEIFSVVVIKSRFVLNVVVFPYALDLSIWNITLGSQEQKLCYIVLSECSHYKPIRPTSWPIAYGARELVKRVEIPLAEYVNSSGFNTDYKSSESLKTHHTCMW